MQCACAVCSRIAPRSHRAPLRCRPRRLLRLLEKIAKGADANANTDMDAAGSHDNVQRAGSDAPGSSSAPSGSNEHGGDVTVRDRRVLIFANKIKAVAFVAQLLSRNGFHVNTLSSQLTQRERDQTLERFKQGKIPVLVATDVAARGVHIEGLRRVVLWDFGTNLEQCACSPGPMCTPT